LNSRGEYRGVKIERCFAPQGGHFSTLINIHLEAEANGCIYNNNVDMNL